MVGKRRERVAPLPESLHSHNTRVENTGSEPVPQGLTDDSTEPGAVEPFRAGNGETPSKLTIEAMLGALRLLYDPKIIAPYRLHSAEHKRLESR
jgi:hypothetical protein